MKHIKKIYEFEDFDPFGEEKEDRLNKLDNENFHILLESTVDNRGDNSISKGDLERIMNSIKNEEFLNFQKEMHEKIRRDVMEWELHVWQVDKDEEIENLFFENLTFEYNEKEITVKTEFDISLPYNWDNRTIMDWVEDFSRITQAYLSTLKAGESYKNNLNFLNRLRRNGRIIITR